MKNQKQGKFNPISKNAENTAKLDNPISTDTVKSRLSVSAYCEISADIWSIFKKYAPDDADLMTFTDDVHALDQKYHEAGDLDAYRFMQKLLKVYFDELNELKGKKGNAENQS